MSIKVTIELIPHGDESAKSRIHTIDIENDGTGTHDFGNYLYKSAEYPDNMHWNNWRDRMFAQTHRPDCKVIGRIFGFRRSNSVKELVLLILQDLIKKETKK